MWHKSIFVPQLVLVAIGQILIESGVEVVEDSLVVVLAHVLELEVALLNLAVQAVQVTHVVSYVSFCLLYQLSSRGGKGKSKIWQLGVRNLLFIMGGGMGGTLVFLNHHRPYY